MAACQRALLKTVTCIKVALRSRSTTFELSSTVKKSFKDVRITLGGREGLDPYINSRLLDTMIPYLTSIIRANPEEIGGTSETNESNNVAIKSVTRRALASKGLMVTYLPLKQNGFIGLKDNINTEMRLAGLGIAEILDPVVNRVPIGVPSCGKEYIIPGANKYKGNILEDPIPSLRIPSPIQDAPSHNSRPEKQAARLIVIRRIKMNKHKLRKLRKKMHFKWAKIKERRYIRKEKAYLDEKLGLIHAAMKFDAKEYVAEVIRKAKEEPLPRKWTDPLMPDWYREQEMAKEARLKRFQKIVNMYLNKEIKVKKLE